MYISRRIILKFGLYSHIDFLFYDDKFGEQSSHASLITMNTVEFFRVIVQSNVYLYLCIIISN